jgi:hypothetical protein
MKAMVIGLEPSATRLRTAVRVLELCGLLLAAGTAQASPLAPARPNAAAKARTPCRGVDSNLSGGSLVTTVPLKAGGRRYQLEVRTTGALGEPRTSSFVVSSGRRTLLREEATGSPGGFTLTVDFGSGVRGARHIELASVDGRTVTGTVDGRALVPFTAGGNTAPDFADGGKVPKLKMKPLLRRVLRKLALCAGQESPTTPAALALISSCDTCNAGCALAFAGCGFATLLSAAAGVGIPTLALNIANCEDALFKCASACARGTACCPVPCAGGHGIALGSTVCEATCSEGAVCCGGSNNPDGQCCGEGGSHCCGSSCLNAGDRCLNPNTGAFCYGAFPGDVCSDTSLSGAAFCCDSSKPVCRDAVQHVCCASNAGELCDIDGGTGCCPSDLPYCSSGTAAGCCAEPVCCDPPSSKCGNTCCNPFTEVCGDATRGLCVEAAPDVVIDQPASGAHLFEDTPVALAGHVFGGTCTNQNGGWTSSTQADEIPQAGCTVSAKFHGLGMRTLTLTVTSPHGTPGSASILVTIDAKPAVVASILAPSASAAINVDNCDEPLLEAYATGASPLTLAWIWQADQLGCAPFSIPASCPPLNIACTVQPPPDTSVSFWHSCGPPAPPCVGSGKIRLQVTDALNQSATDEVAVSLVRNPH